MEFEVQQLVRYVIEMGIGKGSTFRLKHLILYLLEDNTSPTKILRISNYYYECL